MCVRACLRLVGTTTLSRAIHTCWTAPSFAAHHGMCISAECVYADALLLSLGAMRMKSACARA